MCSGFVHKFKCGTCISTYYGKSKHLFTVSMSGHLKISALTIKGVKGGDSIIKENYLHWIHFSGLTLFTLNSFIWFDNLSIFANNNDFPGNFHCFGFQTWYSTFIRLTAPQNDFSLRMTVVSFEALDIWRRRYMKGWLYQTTCILQWLQKLCFGQWQFDKSCFFQLLKTTMSCYEAHYFWIYNSETYTYCAVSIASLLLPEALALTFVKHKNKLQLILWTYLSELVM